MQEGLQRFDYLKLATFFCQVNRKSDVRFIDPFEGMVHAHTIPRETVLQIDIRKTLTHESGNPVVACPLDPSAVRNSPQPTDPFIHPVKKEPMQHDVNDRGVCVYNITCRHYELVPSPLPPGKEEEDIVYALRLSFYNEHMAKLQETREQDKMHEAAGSVRGAFAYLLKSEGKDMQDIPMPNMEFGYQNKQFMKTFMLVDESNLMNGIITIPYEVCVAARLPVWTNQAPTPDERMITKIMDSLKITDPAQKEAQRTDFVKKYQDDFMESHKHAKKSTYFYAVPKDHVMAWPYSSEAYLAQFDFKVEQFRFVDADTKETKLLYYLVPSVPFEESREFFKKTLLGKVDRKPLKDLGFEVVSVTHPPPSFPISFRLKSFFTYWSVPTLSPGTIKCLAPTLCDDYPLPHNWSEDEMQMQLAAEKAEIDREESRHHGKRFTHKQ